MRACVMLLGAGRYAELVAAVRREMPYHRGDLDPYMTAALVCVGTRCDDREFGWSREARGVAMSLVFSAAIDAEAEDGIIAA